jgi:large subunit ribosomal protein L24
MHIRKDDTVVVITGDDAGTAAKPKISKVLRVLNHKNKIVVEGVNRVYKHLKHSRRKPQGGRLSKEMAISLSNVMLYCANCKRGVRIGLRKDAQGGKERFCKKCKGTLGKIGLVLETKK